MLGTSIKQTPVLGGIVSAGDEEMRILVLEPFRTIGDVYYRGLCRALLARHVGFRSNQN